MASITGASIFNVGQAVRDFYFDTLAGRDSVIPQEAGGTLVQSRGIDFAKGNILERAAVSVHEVPVGAGGARGSRGPGGHAVRNHDPHALPVGIQVESGQASRTFVFVGHEAVVGRALAIGHCVFMANVGTVLVVPRIAGRTSVCIRCVVRRLAPDDGACKALAPAEVKPIIARGAFVVGPGNGTLPQIIGETSDVVGLVKSIVTAIAFIFRRVGRHAINQCVGVAIVGGRVFEVAGVAIQTGVGSRNKLVAVLYSVGLALHVGRVRIIFEVPREAGVAVVGISQVSLALLRVSFAEIIVTGVFPVVVGETLGAGVAVVGVPRNTSGVVPHGAPDDLRSGVGVHLGDAFDLASGASQGLRGGSVIVAGAKGDRIEALDLVGRKDESRFALLALVRFEFILVAMVDVGRQVPRVTTRGGAVVPVHALVASIGVDGILLAEGDEGSTHALVSAEIKGLLAFGAGRHVRVSLALEDGGLARQDALSVDGRDVITRGAGFASSVGVVDLAMVDGLVDAVFLGLVQSDGQVEFAGQGGLHIPEGNLGQEVPIEGESIVRLAPLAREVLMLLAVVDSREGEARTAGDVQLVARFTGLAVLLADLPETILNHVRGNHAGALLDDVALVASEAIGDRRINGTVFINFAVGDGHALLDELVEEVLVVATDAKLGGDGGRGDLAIGEFILLAGAIAVEMVEPTQVADFALFDGVFLDAFGATQGTC